LKVSRILRDNVEEYNDEDGGGGVNILVSRDEFGERKIIKVKDTSGALTAE